MIPTAGRTDFGFQLERAAGGWRWQTFGAAGQVSGQGEAPSKQVAAALVIRALAKDALDLPARVN